MRKTICLAAAVLLLCSTAGAAEYACRDTAGNKVRVRESATAGQPDCHKAGPPTPVPVATATPKPATFDCSDGTFSIDPKAREARLLHRVYDEGREYHLCVTLPTLAPAPPFLTLSSVNHSNGTCNIYGVWLTPPNGMTASLPEASQPGAPPLYHAGTWSVVVRLDPTQNRCRDRVTGELVNPGLSLTWRWS